MIDNGIETKGNTIDYNATMIEDDEFDHNIKYNM